MRSAAALTRLSLLAVALLPIAGCRRERTRARREPLTVDAGEIAPVPVHQRVELRFDVPNRTLVPDDVRIRGVFHEPNGKTLTVPGFALADGFAVRYSPRVAGVHRYELFADGGAGETRVREGTFTATAAVDRGFVRVDRRSPHRLVFDDGAPFVLLGETRMNVYDPSWNYANLGIDAYLAQMGQYGMTTLRVFLFNDCERESPPGPQPGCLEPAVGRFDAPVAEAIDQVFDAAERSDIYVILAPWALGFSDDDPFRSWADNPYSTARGGPLKTPAELFTSEVARQAAEKKLRYIVARWGWSSHLLAIDLLEEPIPDATWIPWAEKLSEWLRGNDPYGHLVTAGRVGSALNVGEAPWFSNARNDLVQWHLDGKEFSDPLHLATEMTRRVEDTRRFGKPIFCGAFVFGGEDKTTYDHTHVGIWSALMSGAGALAHSAPQQQLDSEPMTPDRARHFLALSKFMRSLDWTRDLTPARDVGATPPGVRAWSLRGAKKDYRALWVLGSPIGYGAELAEVRLSIPDLPAGRYRVEWWDDVTSAARPVSEIETRGGATRIEVPPFVRHIAGRISPQ